MRNHIKPLLQSLVLCLFAWSAVAEQAPEKGGEEIIHTTLINSNGEATSFAVSDKVALSIANKELGLSYFLTARVVDRGRAEFTIEELLPESKGQAKARSEVFEIAVGNGSHSSTIAPFALSVSEIKTQPPHPTGSTETSKIAYAPGAFASCCIECDGSLYCAYPNPGWCISLTCISNPSETCEACSTPQ